MAVYERKTSKPVLIAKAYALLSSSNSLPTALGVTCQQQQGCSQVVEEPDAWSVAFQVSVMHLTIYQAHYDPGCDRFL